MEEASTGATLFVKYVPEAVSEVDLALDFSQYGTVLKAVLHSRRFAYIHFLDRDEALRAMTIMDQAMYRGKALSVVLAAPQRKRLLQNYVEYPVIVTNVPPTVNKQTIFHILSFKNINVVHNVLFYGENKRKQNKIWKIMCTEEGYAKEIKAALQESLSCDKIRSRTAKPEYTAITPEKPSSSKRQRLDKGPDLALPEL